MEISENTKPFLSIVVPTYNRAALLARLLETVDEAWKKSGLKPEAIEVVVSDNCSSDKTWEFLQSHANKTAYKTRIIRNDVNVGAIRNFVQAAENTLGQWVIICGDDDEMSPNSIAIIEDTTKRHPEKALLSFWTESRPIHQWIDKETSMSLNSLAETYYYFPGNCGFSVTRGDLARKAIKILKDADTTFSNWPITDIAAGACAISDVNEPVLLSPGIIASHPNHLDNTSYSSYYLFGVSHLGLARSAMNVDQAFGSSITERVIKSTFHGTTGFKKLYNLLKVHLLHDLPQDTSATLASARSSLTEFPRSISVFCRSLEMLLSVPMPVKKVIYFILLAIKHPRQPVHQFRQDILQREQNLVERRETLQQNDAPGFHSETTQS